MLNIKLTINYDGTNYHGWQKQVDKPTIQDTIEDALKKLLKYKINLIGSGRTDSGVHAIAQVANFKVPKLKIPPEKLLLALNNILPEDIRITDVSLVDSNFNARKLAIRKTYLYVISNAPIQSPFSARYSWHIPYKLNLQKMREAAKIFLGKKNFKAFMSSGSSVKSTIRTIKKITLRQHNSQILITVVADGFLKQMVRNIVGTLVEVGSGKITAEDVRKILLSKDRKKAGRCAPAKGLFLLRVDY